MRSPLQIQKPPKEEHEDLSEALLSAPSGNFVS
jgi:hypothetical protein